MTPSVIHGQAPDAVGITASSQVKSAYHEFMRLLTSSLIRRSAVYTASSSLNALTNFLLLPVLTRYLSPVDYGIIETFLALAALLSGVIIMGSHTSLSKDYFKLPERERSVYIGNALGLIGAASLVAVGVLLLFRGNVLLGNWLNIPSAVIFAAVVAAVVKAVSSLTQTLFQLQKRAKAFAAFTNLSTLGELALSMFFIVGLRMQWRGRLTGVLTSYIFAAFVALSWLMRHGLIRMLPLNFDRAILRSSLPLTIAHVAGWAVMSGDRLIISHLLNPSATGMYALGSRFAMPILMIQVSFGLAWLPFLYENINKGTQEADLKIVQATYLYSLCLLGISLAYGLFSPYILYAMVSKRFYGASQYILLLSLAYCVDGICKLFLGYLLHHDKTNAYSIILCITSVIDVGLCYSLVKHFGPIAAAWSTLVSLLAGTLITIVVAVKTHKMPWAEVWRTALGSMRLKRERPAIAGSN